MRGKAAAQRSLAGAPRGGGDEGGKARTAAGYSSRVP